MLPACAVYTGQPVVCEYPGIGMGIGIGVGWGAYTGACCWAGCGVVTTVCTPG